MHSRILCRTRTKVSRNSLCTEARDDLFMGHERCNVVPDAPYSLFLNNLNLFDQPKYWITQSLQRNYLRRKISAALCSFLYQTRHLLHQNHPQLIPGKRIQQQWANDHCQFPEKDLWHKLAVTDIVHKKIHIPGSPKIKIKLLFFERIHLNYYGAKQMGYYPGWKTPRSPQNTYR